MPKTLDELVGRTLEVLPEEDQRRFRGTDERRAVSLGHWSFGMWLRNQFIWSIKAPVSETVRQEMRKSGEILTDPDAISRIMIRHIWGSLNGYPPLSVGELCKAPYRKSLRPEDAPADDAPETAG